MTRFLFFTLGIMSLSLNSGLTQDSIRLAYTSHQDKLGFINQDGVEVIPVEFDAVLYFSEGIVPVNKGAKKISYESIGGKWGFWDKSGKEIIPPKYEAANIFTQGLAAVKQEGRFGYIDTHDQLIIDFQFEDAKPFSEDLAAVKLGEKWGFIDMKGELVVQPVFDRVANFQHGFSVVFHKSGEYEMEEDGDVYIEEYGKYGLIDRDGVLVQDIIFDQIDSFQEGFAKIQLDRKEGFLGPDGQIAIPIEYDQVKVFSEGLAAVGNYMMRESPYDFGYTQVQIDSLEEEVAKLTEEIMKTGDFNDLLNHPTYQAFSQANMQKPSEKLTYGYINTKGETVIDLQYDEADPFMNGFAVIGYGPAPAMYYQYKINGEDVFPNDGAMQGVGENIIDTTGTTKLKENQRFINRSSAYFVGYSYQGPGVYSREFELMVPPGEYLNIHYIGDSLFVGELKDSKTKVILNQKGEQVLKTKFWSIERITKNRLLVDAVMERDGRRVKTLAGIIDETDNWILKPKYEFVTGFKAIP